MNKEQTSQFKTTKDTKCDYCLEKVLQGATMFYDNYRGQHYCERCEQEYWQGVEQEEGLNGIKLK